ncbi:MAG: hypothetical protein ACQERZ_09410 [Fusobacteriota bacterium]
MERVILEKENIHSKVKKRKIFIRIFLKIKKKDFFKGLNNTIEKLSNNSLNLKIENKVNNFIENIY